MVNYNVNDQTTWNMAAASTLTAADTVTITGNFTFTTSFNTITLNGASVDGQNYTVTIGISGVDIAKGMFQKLEGGTIQNIIIDGNGSLWSNYNWQSGVLLNVYSGLWTDRKNYGTIQDCTIDNMEVWYSTGALCGSYFGNTDIASTVRRCSATNMRLLGLSSRPAPTPFCGSDTRNVTFDDCLSVSTYVSAGHCQYIAGFVGHGTNLNLTFINCYVQMTLKGNVSTTRDNSGLGYGGAGTINVTECIVEMIFEGASLFGNSGLFGYLSSGTILSVTDSYVIGDFTDSGDLPFVYSAGGSTINLTNVYHSGAASTPGSVCRSSGSAITLNLENSYFAHANYITGGTEHTINTTGTIGLTSDISGIVGNTWDDTTTWTAVTDEPPILKSFNASPWIASIYDNYDDQPLLDSNDIPIITASNTDVTLITNSAMTAITITNTGGNALYSVSPSLPTGLSIDSITGTISGTPTVDTADATYTVTATNSGGTDTVDITIEVISTAVPDITPSSSTATLTKGTAMTNITFTNTGDSAIFTISPSLPTGLSIDSSTGTISGLPTAETASATYTVTATNDGGTDTANITIVVNLIIPSISASSITEVLTKGTALTDITITNTGDAATFTVSPTLPTGLSISSSTGTISGTPSTETAETTYTVTSTNSGGTDTVTITITVNLIIPSITASSSTAILTINSVMTNITFTNTGDTSTFTVSPTLPTGLSISSSTGTISGTPTTETTETIYTITATNSGGTDVATVTMTVNLSVPSITASSASVILTLDEVMTNITMTNTGDTATFTVSPTLPTGLSISSETGTISGTPIVLNVIGTNYTITATNSGGTDTATVNIKVHDSYVTDALDASNLAATVSTIAAVALPSTTSTSVTLNTGLMNLSEDDFKRQRRRTLLNVVFTRSGNLDKTVFKTTKTELGLPSTFSKTNVLTYKTGQTINLSTIPSTEGAYANIYANGETVTFLNVGGSNTVVFTAVGGGDYTATLNGTSTGSTYSEGNSTMISGTTFYFGSVYTEGDSATGICFMENTLIRTTRGLIPIQYIIGGDKIIFGPKEIPVHCLVRTINLTGHMVLIKKNAIGHKAPSRDTYVTHNHKVLYNSKLVEVKNLINGRDIKIIKTGHNKMYSILTHEYTVIAVNNLIFETLDPNGGFAKTYMVDK